MEKLFETIFNSVNDGILIYNLEGRFLEVNQITCDDLGYQKDELLQMTGMDITPPEFREKLHEEMVGKLNQGGGFVETMCRCKDGSLVPIELNIRPIEYKGSPAILAVVRDITERKREEEKLQEATEKYYNLTENLNEIIYRADPETLMPTYVNQATERIYGYTVEEWLNDPTLWEKSICPDDIERVFAELTELQTKLESGIIEYRIIKKDKSIRWVQDHINWEKDQQGKPISINGILYDITERKRAERKLRESEEKFKTLFENANDAIYVTDLNGQFMEVNQMACDQLGYTRSELLQMNPKDIDSIDDIAQVEDRIGWLFQHNHTLFETVHIRKDGSTFPVEVNIRLIDYMGKKAFLGISRDISKHKKAEEAMLNSKIAAEAANQAKSEFLTNMSHELRTPLNSIIGFSDILCSEDFGALNETQRHYLHNVNKSGKHLLELINDMLDLSKIEAGKMKLFPEEFVVLDTINEIRSTMMPLAKKKEIELKCSINIEDPIIVADVVKFKQILYNLVSNAIKFTDQGGSVTIGLDRSDEQITIFVEDTGVGISQNDQKNLFDPFIQVDSSPSREYGGTGLGLALVKYFVEMHGGEVWVDSEVGKGSTFWFSIPANLEIYPIDQY